MKEEKVKEKIFATPDLVKGTLVDSFYVALSEDAVLIDCISPYPVPKEGKQWMEERDVIVSRLVLKPETLFLLKRAVDETLKDYEKEYKKKIKAPEIGVKEGTIE